MDTTKSEDWSGLRSANIRFNRLFSCSSSRIRCMSDTEPPRFSCRKENPCDGGVFSSEFEKEGKEIKVRIEGQLVFNNIALRMNAALQGLGLAYMPDDLVQAHLADGRLIRVLEDWCEPFDGYHLYYPSRRQTSRAFTVFRDALRYAG